MDPVEVVEDSSVKRGRRHKNEAKASVDRVE
jgi:hypothetical protein